MFSSEHSFLSTHSLPLASSSNPSRHSQRNEPSLLIQMPLMQIPGFDSHSLISKMPPSGKTMNPDPSGHRWSNSGVPFSGHKSHLPWWAHATLGPVAQQHSGRDKLPSRGLIHWPRSKPSKQTPSLTSTQDIPSGVCSKPGGHLHSNPPSRFLHSPTGQACSSSAHSSLSKHVFLSEDSLKPSGQVQINVPSVFWQVPRSHITPSSEHSSRSRQFCPSDVTVYPS